MKYLKNNVLSHLKAVKKALSWFGTRTQYLLAWLKLVDPSRSLGVWVAKTSSARSY